MKVLEYIIRALDRTKEGTDSAARNTDTLSQRVGRNLMNIQAGWQMLSGTVKTVAKAIWSTVQEAFRFERAQAEFKVLLNSVDAAKSHVADLKQFAASTPLAFTDLANASKQLLSFGMDINDVVPTLKMLGDVSMGDAEKLRGLTLAFAQVKSTGRLMGQDLLQMINQGFNPLTVIAQQTGRSMGELKEMMENGAISFEMVAEAMRIATSEGGLFFGAMDEASKTGEGQISNLKDNWTAALREIGSAFSDEAKGGIKTFSDALADLVDSGKLRKWVEDAVASFKTVSEAAGNVGKWLSDTWVGKAAGKVAEVSWNSGVKARSNIAYGLSRLTGSDSEEAAFVRDFYRAEHGKGAFRDRAVKSFSASPLAGPRKTYRGYDITPLQDPREIARLEEHARLDEITAVKNSTDAINDKTTATKNTTIQEMMAAEQKRLAEERNVAATLKLAQSREKAAARQALAESKQLEQTNRERVQRATAAAQQAWAEYRDPELRARNQQEREAEAQAREKYQRDLKWIESKYTKWNDKTLDDLTERDYSQMKDWEHATMNVYRSDKEKQSSEAALGQIEKNTADLAAKLDTLLQVKGA